MERDPLETLRVELQQAESELKAAEEELSRRRKEIYAFEAVVEKRTGDLVAALSGLEEEIKEATKTIEAVREDRLFGKEHGFKGPDYWRNWTDRPADASPPPQEPLQDELEAQIKNLYRQLAREFHPDLAEDEATRVYREERMAAVNEAYKNRNLAVLKMLAVEARLVSPARFHPPEVSRPKDPEKALEFDLARCRRRVKEVRDEINGLHRHPSVELSLEVKLARREGRDLLSEMAADLRKKIARRTVERDYLKAALNQLDQDN